MTVELRFERSFEGRSPEQVFDSLSGWLAQEGAEIKEASKPSRIVAVHGSYKTVSGWKRGAKKKMTFEMKPTGSGVLVLAILSPTFANASDVVNMIQEARAEWGELLAEAWAKVDGRVAEEARKQIVEDRARLEMSRGPRIRAMKRTAVISGALGIALFAIAFLVVLPVDRRMGQAMAQFSVVPFVYAAIALFYVFHLGRQGK